MSRANIDRALIRGAMLVFGNRLGVNIQALAGTTQIPGDSEHVLMWDPNGAGRTVKLPANPKRGDFFILVNTADAAEVITVQDSAGNALTPACTPTQSEIAIIIYSGDATLGWRSAVMLGA